MMIKYDYIPEGFFVNEKGELVNKEGVKWEDFVKNNKAQVPVETNEKEVKYVKKK